MSQKSANPIPKGFHSLTPYLVCNDASAAIEFYKRAFGAVEQFRLPGPNGKIIHSCLQIGDSPLMVSDEFAEMGAFGPQHFGGSPVTIHLSVTDVDASAARAAAAGARVVMTVADTFWGARYGVLQDPYGHSWSIATQVRELTTDEVKAAFEKQMCEAAA